MLANNFFDNRMQPTFDPTDWWLSEKFDGQRAIWTGQQLCSRSGNIIRAPEWFLQLMPEGVALDGELWTGRQKFGGTGIFRTKVPNSRHWLKATYQVFDIPGMPSKVGFEDRIEQLAEVVENIWDRWDTVVASGLPERDRPALCPVRLVEHIEVENMEHFEKVYREFLNEEAEGVMLRRPGSQYVSDRSDNLMKCKPYFDEEGVVIGYEGGMGKNSQRLGAFQVRSLRTGVEFTLSGMVDAVRERYRGTHPVGTVIQYKYYDGLDRNGAPRHPIYMGYAVNK